MKYKIINTAIQINNIHYPENSVVELSQDQIKGLEPYLIPLNNSSLSVPVVVSSKKFKNKKRGKK